MDQQPTPDEYISGINRRAEVFVDNSKPLRLYLRSADSLFKQACIYKRENDLERAYVLFLKYSNLVIQELPKHPEYQSGSEQIRPLRSNCVTALDICESTRNQLREQYQSKLASDLLSAKERKAQSEAAARSAYEKALEQQKMEEARAARMREIQMKEAQRTYELQKQKEAEAVITGSRGSDDLAYLDLVEPLAPAKPPPPPPVFIPPPPPLQFEKPVASPTSKYFSESGAVLRGLVIPSNIVSVFLEIAASNTRKNIETCGVLAGRLAQNKFTITHLVIPKQEGTSDTCAMIAEEEIFTVQDSLDLLTLGWIHTHPTQQCFLSSVDLHTHFPYQLMMAEAIAIVVAPTQSPNFGIFRLTDPPGLDIIASCPARGFHQHPGEHPIYRSLGGPKSHTQFDGMLKLAVIDLRNK